MLTLQSPSVMQTSIMSLEPLQHFQKSNSNNMSNNLNNLNGHHQHPDDDLNQLHFNDIFDGVFREVSVRDVREQLLHAQVYMSDGDWCTAKSVCQHALERSSDARDSQKIAGILKEIALFQDRSIHALQAPAPHLQWRHVQTRPVQKVFENHHHMPQSLFFIRHEETSPGGETTVRFTVGRRLLSHQYREGRISELHCSLITPSMILGPLEDQRMREDGITVYFRPMTCGEKLRFMHQLLEEETMRMTEVVFPFPVLHPDDRTELSCPSDGWQISEDLAEQLEEGEEILREHSVEFLKSLGRPDLRLFDPACSNGVFLQHLKEALPGCHTIGQDLSSNMVAYAARKGVDEVHCGDCRQPAVAQESVDVVFCRFLNSEIVKTSQVMDLLLPVSRCVKVGGHVVLFGHTPVLVSAADLADMPGWKVLSSVAGGAKWNGLFQYYVCQRLS